MGLLIVIAFRGCLVLFLIGVTLYPIGIGRIKKQIRRIDSNYSTSLNDKLVIDFYDQYKEVKRIFDANKVIKEKIEKERGFSLKIFNKVPKYLGTLFVAMFLLLVSLQVLNFSELLINPQEKVEEMRERSKKIQNNMKISS